MLVGLLSGCSLMRLVICWTTRYWGPLTKNRDVMLGFSRYPFSIEDGADRTHSLASPEGHFLARDFESATDQFDDEVLRYWQVSNGCPFLESKHLYIMFNNCILELERSTDHLGRSSRNLEIYISRKGPAIKT